MDIKSLANAMIWQAYQPLIDKYGITKADIDTFIERSTHLECECETDCLIYYLINVCKYQMRGLWPLSDDELEPYFIASGYAFE